MGYPADKIEQANDWVQDPVFGLIYGAELRSTINEEGDRNEWQSRSGGTSAAAGGKNSGGNNNRAARSNQQKAKDNGRIAEREALNPQKSAEILAKHAIAQITPFMSMIKIKRADKHTNELPKMAIDAIEGHTITLAIILERIA